MSISRELQNHRILDQLMISQLGPQHLEELVELHSRILWWSFNGRMGKDHIRALYSALISDPNVFGFVCHAKGRFVGFVSATTNSTSTRKSIQQVYSKKFILVLKNLVQNPKAVLSILESKFLVPRIFRKFNCHAEWLTFVTDMDASFITPFASAKLIAALNARFMSMGITNYMAQGIKDNPAAMKFYKALGWKVVHALPMHNIYLYDSRGPLGA